MIRSSCSVVMVFLSSSSRACDGEPVSVGSTSGRVALRPPESRTIWWNDVFSSSSHRKYSGASAFQSPEKRGSLMLSSISRSGSSRSRSAICVHPARYFASTSSWWFGMSMTQVLESWCMLTIT